MRRLIFVSAFVAACGMGRSASGEEANSPQNRAGTKRPAKLERAAGAGQLVQELMDRGPAECLARMAKLRTEIKQWEHSHVPALREGLSVARAVRGLPLQEDSIAVTVSSSRVVSESFELGTQAPGTLKKIEREMAVYRSMRERYGEPRLIAYVFADAGLPVDTLRPILKAIASYPRTFLVFEKTPVPQAPQTADASPKWWPAWRKKFLHTNEPGRREAALLDAWRRLAGHCSGVDVGLKAIPSADRPSKWTLLSSSVVEADDLGPSQCLCEATRTEIYPSLVRFSHFFWMGPRYHAREVVFGEEETPRKGATTVKDLVQVLDRLEAGAPLVFARPRP